MHLKRYLNTRNLQHLDQNYLKLKEKILWPLFEFQKKDDPAKTGSRSSNRKRVFMTSDANKTGRVPRTFKKLPSVKKVKNRRPLYKGDPNDMQNADATSQKSDSDDEELDSEEEKERNKPFFETMEYWKFKQEARESVLKGKRIKPKDKNKEPRKKSMSNNLHQNYQTARMNRRIPNFDKLKPEFKEDAALANQKRVYNQALYVFNEKQLGKSYWDDPSPDTNMLDLNSDEASEDDKKPWEQKDTRKFYKDIFINEMWLDKSVMEAGYMCPFNEQFFTHFFEKTQAELKAVLKFEQFASIPWIHGLPRLFVEFISVITGNEAKTLEFFAKMKPVYKEVLHQKLNKLIA